MGGCVGRREPPRYTTQKGTKRSVVDHATESIVTLVPLCATVHEGNVGSVNLTGESSTGGARPETGPIGEELAAALWGRAREVMHAVT
jgi:hypothetical protein